MSTSVKATKKSAFSCEPCRRRKVKCGGEQPVCNRCASRKDDCVYKLNPTLSYTQRLEQRIKELEDQVATYSKSPISTVPSSSHSSPPAFSPHDAPSHSRLVVEDHPSLRRPSRGFKMEDRGAGIAYPGTAVADFFHPSPSERNTNSSSRNSFLPLTESDSDRRERLVNNALQQRALETMSDIPEPFQYLLKLHWCWVQPLFNFVYRPAFTRDMQTMGPYYSHTLLNAMLSHSIRWGVSDPTTKRILDESYEGGAIFGTHARRMVFEEVSSGNCTVPTVQTLLLLSAQECGFGNNAQAWMYSGLAFRLIEHLGICVDGDRYLDSAPLTDEDVEIRHRLFWSCYIWDKMISLYLGRSPTIQRSAVSPPHDLFDDSAENVPWDPFGTPSGQLAGTGWNYPSATAHATSCFTYMCQLSVIFNQILVHMYDPLMQNTDDEVDECLHTQEAALQHWWDQLPPFLRIEPGNLPAVAPPSHVVTMNCLYHTFKILLYRPMLTRRRHVPEDEPAPVHSYLVHCVTSATSIIAIFNLFVRDFTTDFCVMSLSYTLYIAATIYLLQVQAFPDDQHALHRLDFCIRSLGEVKKYCPMIGGALDLVTRELAALGLTVDSMQPVTVHTPESTASGSIPATAAPFLPEVTAAAAAAAHQPVTSQAEYLFQFPWGVEGFGGPDPLVTESGVFESMSTLEPLSAYVGTIHDYTVHH